MNADDEKKKPFPFPPSLVVADIISVVLIGLCLTEILPGRSGKALGLISPALVWPIMAIAIPVALFCAFKMAMIAKNIAKERDTEPKQKAKNTAMWSRYDPPG
jgi:phosphotransferase system  glucose/maltose/N-acetylglucosamine-specific IIC component